MTWRMALYQVEGAAERVVWIEAACFIELFVSVGGARHHRRTVEVSTPRDTAP
jgi:hypothetical protein